MSANTGKRTLCLAMSLVAVPAALPAWAQDVDTPPPPAAGGLVELSDEELGDMRGRYTIDDRSVAWFGVTMVSAWQTEAGQQLQSRMTLALDMEDPTKPKVSFQPHVSITRLDVASPVPASGKREIDDAGLANVSGVVQSVQVAGDRNIARNVARVSLREDDMAPTGAGATGSGATAGVQVAAASAPGMSAIASLEGNAARVMLSIQGHGAVEQWIGSSGLGQSIQLASDGQQASNWLELDVVRSPAQSRAPLGQNVAQAIALSRGIAIGY